MEYASQAHGNLSCISYGLSLISLHAIYVGIRFCRYAMSLCAACLRAHCHKFMTA